MENPLVNKKVETVTCKTKPNFFLNFIQQVATCIQTIMDIIDKKASLT